MMPKALTLFVPLAAATPFHHRPHRAAIAELTEHRLASEAHISIDHQRHRRDTN
jgi:hypothetical protein